jgi:hypothetical protein
VASYLARYLNVPSARIPGDDGESLDNLPANAAARSRTRQLKPDHSVAWVE